MRAWGIILVSWSLINLVAAAGHFGVLLAGYSTRFTVFLIVFNFASFLITGLAGLYLLRNRRE